VSVPTPRFAAARCTPWATSNWSPLTTSPG